MSDRLKVGDQAPNIEAETFGGEKIKLSDFKNKNIVALYFYPRDNTPTCTKEACSIRDGSKDFEKLGIKVLGVSTDSVKSHENFKKKYDLNFPLLSDKSKEIIQTYGVKSAFGSAKRETFLIDKAGKIRYIWEKVNAANHAHEVLEKVRELKLTT